MNLATLTLLAQANQRTLFEWGQIQSNADWILPIGLLLAILLFVRYLYRRDAVELSPVWGWLLTALRTAVFIGLLVFFLQPQWRTEIEQTINSRVLVAVDTSLSMGLTDADDSAGGSDASRVEQAASVLAQTDFLKQLRKVHDVEVVPFDQELHRNRVLFFPKLSKKAQAANEAAADESPAAEDRTAEDSQPNGQRRKNIQTDPTRVDWSKALRLSGEETRLGQALEQLVNDEAGAPLAGLVVFSDGGQNAGAGAEAAVQAAHQSNIPIFAVGLGSDRQPANVRVAAFNPPPRAYPGDPYSVTGVVQAWRMAGQTVTVQLLARKTGSSASAPAERGTGDQVADPQQVTLGADGEEVPVKFQVTPGEIGRQTLCLKVLAPESDRDKADNMLEAEIEIIDRKNHVLLLAGGPTREYQFLRNLLYRDKSTTSDILLQTAKQGISQEAAKILDEFPTTREEMFKYDCLIAFDPDWQALEPAQVDLLENWVAEQGGGLIVVAGPVYTGKAINGWVQDADMAKIRALYPVEFPRRLSSVDANAYTSKEPWPLAFSREGAEADFLMLTESPLESRAAWANFPGVYGYFPVRGAKQGATVLARFSDPRTAQNGEQPVFMAWQFYGSGRVFYLGSGEMWRLRSLDDRYFEQFYTKVIRHASKGRLLRGSTRGMLLVGQERYRLGNTVSVQAYRLTNAQLAPLEAPSVSLQIVQPNQAVQTIALRQEVGRPGCYAGQFTALQEGDYRLELPVPESDDERLTQRIHVDIPNLEREHPQRNDAVLGDLASKTGGKYFVGASRLFNDGAIPATMLADRTKTVIQTAAPSRDWEMKWLGGMMVALFSLLCLEWLIRRLLKLA